jgi:hypothetical protein
MTEPSPSQAGASRGRSPLKLLPWVIAAACFAYLYWRLSAAAAREGTTLVPYMAEVFRSVSWDHWLALMIPYSIFFFLVDSLVVWRVVSWFNARVAYLDILPVRASTYILSILNEQVGKGAIAIYLNRRDGVPGWQMGSSMLFIMVCEFYYLLAWATLGVALQWDQLPDMFHALPFVALVAFPALGVAILYFRGRLLPGSNLRDRPILHAFRQATPRHYAGVILLRSPALLAAVLVYTQALALFGVEVTMGTMLGYLPVIFFGAAVPGPFRTVAIAMWVTLFPEKAGSMATFGLVQHNFFIFFNAAIGLLFLRRANREIFGDGGHELGDQPSA